ncbi:MAG TPA: type II secretion system protein [Candidatus Binatia bacterium]|nr:type II secretion system protein [Candidatus Binatia bacterium]
MNRRTSSRTGFTLLELMIVVAVIGLLAAIAFPNYVRARTTSQTNACINNLRQIDGATQQWALENKQAPSAAVSYSKISGYLRNSVICPAGGTTFGDSYLVSTVTNRPTCLQVPASHVLQVETSN